MRRVLALSSLALLAFPAGAPAHAALERTVPPQGSRLKAAPRLVAFDFSEPVETSFGSVRLFDSRGEEVPTGELIRPDGRSDAVGVEPPPGLADGTYTATYHVISADSHPVSGGFVFTVGQGSASEKSVAELLDEDSAGPVTGAALVVVRFLGYAAMGIAIGGLVFLLVAFRPARFPVDARAAFGRRLRPLLLAAVAVGLLATLAALPLQAASAGGTSFFSALDPARIAEVLDTRFGQVMALRVAAWIALGAALAVAASRGLLAGRDVAAWLLVVIAGCLLEIAVTPALSGHAGTQGPAWILFPADVVHVLGMAVWAGGLVALLAAVPAATRALPARERAGGLVRVTKRFSAMALAAVLALALTGTIQAVIEVGSVSDLFATGFGRAVVAKAALFMALVGLGWSNRGRIIPGLERIASRAAQPGGMGLALRRNLRVEAALIAAVLAVTSVLVGYAPPGESAPGPASGRTRIGEQVLEYTVDPARVGANQVHLYLFDASDGSQFDGAVEVTATAAHDDIGPLDVSLRKAGPGHYLAPAAVLGAPGEWTLTVQVRTSRFDQEEARFGVPVS